MGTEDIQNLLNASVGEVSIGAVLTGGDFLFEVDMGAVYQ